MNQEDAAMQQVRRQPEFDEYGLLRNPADWTPDLAGQLARLEGLMELGPQHWSFLKALRDYYQRFHVPPGYATTCTWNTAAATCCFPAAWPPGASPTYRTRGRRQKPTSPLNSHPRRFSQTGSAYALHGACPSCTKARRER
jgi:hypothetical protein